MGNQIREKGAFFLYIVDKPKDVEGAYYFNIRSIGKKSNQNIMFYTYRNISMNCAWFIG